MQYIAVREWAGLTISPMTMDNQVDKQRLKLLMILNRLTVPDVARTIFDMVVNHQFLVDARVERNVFSVGVFFDTDPYIQRRVGISKITRCFVYYTIDNGSGPFDNEKVRRKIKRNTDGSVSAGEINSNTLMQCYTKVN